MRGFISGGLVKKTALKIEAIKRESGDRACPDRAFDPHIGIG